MALDITCVYVGALPSDGKGVYTQVKWQLSFDHWQCQQKADWESLCHCGGILVLTSSSKCIELMKCS